MRIKFIKEYQAFYDFEGSFEASNTYKVGEIKNVTSKSAQWLIDNGFAEEVKESGWWKPKNGEAYYSLNSYGSVSLCTCWKNDHIDRWRYSMGNVFKTEKAAERYCDYRKAVVTIRQDEGIVCLEEIGERHDLDDGNYHVYTVGSDPDLKELVVLDSGDCITANSIWFGDEKHARASLDKHPDEWKTIVNYNWSRE